MAIDFFAGKCSTTVNAKRFGLCDAISLPQDQAYFQTEKTADWIANVNNPEAREVLFTALDHCIDVRRQDNPTKQESLCDCMLTYDDRIAFVELKDRDYPGVLAEAKAQLANTIRLFSNSHNLMTYKVRRAFYCNKRKPNFPYSQQAEIDAFRREHNVILIPFAIIEIR